MRRHFVRLLAVPLLLLASLSLSSSPADAVAPSYNSASKYVAMGDSFSAGVGAPFGDPVCGRSPLGYPTLWAQAHGITSFTDVSCGGAVADDVLTKQVSGLSADTDVITLTIGGNDTGWGNTVMTCMSSGDAACTSSVDQDVATLPVLAAKLDAAYAAIRQAAPHADVYVLGYPHLFEETADCSAWIVPDQFQREELNRLAQSLDETIANRSARAGFTFVDAQPFFAGHAVCSSQAWINPVLNPTPLHPTPDGYKYGYLAALESATG